MNGGKPCGRYSQAIPVRFTYKIAFTISRRSCTGSLRPRPASARAARQAARIGSTNAHRGSDRSLRYARREVMTAIFSRSGTESAGPRTQKYLPAETDRDHSGSDALLGPSSLAFCLSLCGDAFCAGEIRRQELSGSVQRRGRFVEDRIEGLEDVRHPRGDVEGDLDVGGGGLPGAA